MHSNPATNSVGHASIFGPVLSCEFSTSQASLADLIPQTPPASLGRKTFLSLKFINHHMTFHMASKPPRSYCRFPVVNPLPCLRELFKNSANPSSKWPWCSWFTARENKWWTELWLHVKMIHLLFVVLASKTGGTNKYIYVALHKCPKERGKWKGHFPILFVLQVQYRQAILIYEFRIYVSLVERKKYFRFGRSSHCNLFPCSATRNLKSLLWLMWEKAQTHVCMHSLYSLISSNYVIQLIDSLYEPACLYN